MLTCEVTVCGLLEQFYQDAVPTNSITHNSQQESNLDRLKDSRLRHRYCFSPAAIRRCFVYNRMSNHKH